MTFWGILGDGSEMLLGKPRRAALFYDREAPADLLEAEFPADRMWEELRELRIYEAGKLVFGGMVDEQNTRLDGTGLSVELVCRSWEALLLDNEAPPVPIRNPSPRLLQRRLLEPLGLALAECEGGTGWGELTVEKGTSCWSVLERYCREYLGTVPYVAGDRSVHCEGLPERAVELENVLSAQISRLPCREVSEVWQQGYQGGYGTLYRGRNGAGKRRRYLSMESGKSPKELLENSRRESFLLTVECAGAWWPVKNVRASVTVEHAGRFSGCPVRSAAYLCDEKGERTRLVLERGEQERCG